MDDSNTERLLERLVRLVVEDRLLRVLFLCGFLLEDILRLSAVSLLPLPNLRIVG